MASNERSIGDDVSADERDALLTIAHGAVVTSGGLSIQRSLTIWIEAILTRGLGPELYGVYALGWRIMGMLLRFSNLGSQVTLLRDLPAYSNEPVRQRRVLGLGYATTAIASTAIAVTMVLTAEWINDVTIEQPVFPEALRLFAVLFVLFGFVRLHATVLKAAKSANGEVLFNRVLRPTVRLIAAAVAVSAGYSVTGVVGALVVAFGVLAVCGYPTTVAVIGIRPTVRGLRSEARHFYDHAIPSALGGVGGLLRTRIDVLLIGALLTATDAGIYNVVLVIVGIAAIPLSSFNQLMPPVASDLYSDGELAALDTVYTTITRLIVTFTVPVIALIGVFGPELLGLFGDEFRRGYVVLLVFLVGRFIGNAVGATGILLSMTNHQYAKMWLEWLLAVLNVVLTYVFVVEFGLVGAALGTSVAIGIQNILQLTLLVRFEGLWPFDATFFKPIGAGFGMAGVMVGVRMVLPGTWSLGVGAFAGIAAFVALIAALGINPRDRFVVRELVAQYRFTIGTKIAEIR